MPTLKIYEVEEKQLRNGKTIKKCVIQEEGKQYPYKNVTVWDNYPEYAGVQAGAVFTHSRINVTEQEGTRNPNNGKPYNNYTLEFIKEQNANGTSKPAQNDENSVILTRIEGKIDKLLSMATGGKNEPQNDYPMDDIDPSQIPF